MKPRPWILSMLLLAGCAAQERVVLLPASDGHKSAIVVSKPGAEVVLETPYSSAEIGKQRIEPRLFTEAEVKQRYGDVLKAQPRRPQSIDLYFSQGDTLTKESQALIGEVGRRIAELPAPEIIIIGHTDRVGSEEANDRLSLRRAEALRTALVGLGIPADTIQTVGRGEREPRIPTADEVAEPRNRRVELKLR